eukprot:CAMPEP_0170527886 /NCGR_PEP_ID=MMETSP0209-20121228/13378_1 /TAXON_ID=665100 ORGANISM="Litonotus pictus, Strain P1" /NCGR_SAMPLE_ID=MMETSP0209 /ASSEMBLY_ACC=CAM_ASM_000301 /LENGTH=177 /DNA_ID=CAMNT_0010818741 /DNA_START=86 /DNA_END=619 /DNA_ORIENTATION=-
MSMKSIWKDRKLITTRRMEAEMEKDKIVEEIEKSETSIEVEQEEIIQKQIIEEPVQKPREEHYIMRSRKETLNQKSEISEEKVFVKPQLPQKMSVEEPREEFNIVEVQKRETEYEVKEEEPEYMIEMEKQEEPDIVEQPKERKTGGGGRPRITRKVRADNNFIIRKLDESSIVNYYN